MSSVTQRGSVGPIQLEDDYEWDSKNGPRTIRRWRGTRAEVYGYLPFIQQAGNRVSIRREGDSPLYLLELRAAEALDGSKPDAAANATLLWTKHKNIEQLSIKLRAAEKGFPSKLLSTIELEVGTWRNGDSSAAEARVSDEASNEAFDVDKALDLLALWAGRGTDSFMAIQWVLRKTQIVPQAFVPPANTDILLILTPTQLYAAEPTIPAYITQDLPSDGFWLNLGTDAEQLSDLKGQLTTEWWWSRGYSTFIYNAKT